MMVKNLIEQLYLCHKSLHLSRMTKRIEGGKTDESDPSLIG